ncbi:RHS repeat-associated core domain-containing protein [Anaerobium acetethylicum]|uniref:RHS repeat-associated core domain-containing protein n=1 Tax=Anaerobium acetethylicum TaxID=1619234 RepID=UPI000A8E7748|nr:RHS repeat-associated core domain-containing protein [Anaerobium acetethylicum]
METGLYYINARMYDPLTARFLQEDTYTGNPNDPLSLNLYTYCHNDPVSYDDPTGHKRKNIVQKWVAKAKKAVKKTAKKVASTAKKAVNAVKKGGRSVDSAPSLSVPDPIKKDKLKKMLPLLL